MKKFYPPPGNTSSSQSSTLSNSKPLPYENGFDKTCASPQVSTSRYGRTRKPKISEDFCDIDDAILGRNSPSLVQHQPQLKTSSPLRKIPTPNSASPEKPLRPLQQKQQQLKPQQEKQELQKLPQIKTIDLTKPVDAMKTLHPPIPDDDFDVSDVLKIVAKTSPNLPTVTYSTPFKTQIKTYHNKRKSYHYKETVIETFGLPDSPIEERKYPSTTFKPSKIDVKSATFPAKKPATIDSGWDTDDTDSDDEDDDALANVQTSPETAKLVNDIHLGDLSSKLQHAIEKNPPIAKQQNNNKRNFPAIARTAVVPNLSAKPLQKTIVTFDKSQKLTNPPLLQKLRPQQQQVQAQPLKVQVQPQQVQAQVQKAQAQPEQVQAQPQKVQTQVQKAQAQPQKVQPQPQIEQQQVPAKQTIINNFDFINIEDAEIIFIDDEEAQHLDLSEFQPTTIQVLKENGSPTLGAGAQRGAPGAQRSPCSFQDSKSVVTTISNHGDSKSSGNNSEKPVILNDFLLKNAKPRNIPAPKYVVNNISIRKPSPVKKTAPDEILNATLARNSFKPSKINIIQGFCKNPRINSVKIQESQDSDWEYGNDVPILVEDSSSSDETMDQMLDEKTGLLKKICPEEGNSGEDLEEAEVSKEDKVEDAIVPVQNELSSTSRLSESPESSKTKSARKTKHEVRRISADINFVDDNAVQKLTRKVMLKDDDEVPDDSLEFEDVPEKDPDFKLKTSGFVKLRKKRGNAELKQTPKMGKRRSSRFILKSEPKAVKREVADLEEPEAEEELPTTKVDPKGDAEQTGTIEVEKKLAEDSEEKEESVSSSETTLTADETLEENQQALDTEFVPKVKEEVISPVVVKKKLGRPRKDSSVIKIPPRVLMPTKRKTPMVNVRKIKKSFEKKKTKVARRPIEVLTKGRGRPRKIVQVRSEHETTDEEVKIKKEPEETKPVAIPETLNSLVKTQFSAGDLCWARIGWYPFWPCLITHDPETNQFYKLQQQKRRLVLSYHVRFFADNGRRSWIWAQNTILFKTSKDLEELAKKIKALLDKTANGFVPEYRNREILSACQINHAKTPKWALAVAEAEGLLEMKREEREAFFANFMKKANARKRNHSESGSTNNSSGQVEKKRKRRDSEEDSWTPKRRVERAASLPPPISLRRKSEAGDGPKRLTRKSFAVAEAAKQPRPKSPPKKAALVVDEGRRTRKAASAFADPSFRMYVKNNIKLMRKEHPDLKDSALETMLQKLWQDLAPDLKKYYKRGGGSNGDTDYSPSDTDASSKETTASSSSKTKRVKSPVVFESQYMKKNYLFRRVPKDKVCQICEKGVNVLKCKGTCGGLFHAKCLEKECRAEFASLDCSFTSTNSDTTSDETETTETTTDSDIPAPAVSEPEAKPPAEEAKKPVMETDLDRKLREIMEDIAEITKYASSTTDDSALSNSEISISPVKKAQSGGATKKKIVKHVTADGVFFGESDDEPGIGKEETPAVAHAPPIANAVAPAPTPQVAAGAVAPAQTAAAADDFICKQCSDGIVPLCFACGKATSQTGNSVRVKCNLNGCGKYYHHDCLKIWPQTVWLHSKKNSTDEEDSFTCPLHFCHTCVSDDPRGTSAKCSNDKIAKCLHCPATYHNSTFCIPAGTEILSQHQVVCAKHYIYGKRNRSSKGKPHNMKNVNASWCFICSEGGSLICCETCPTSFHAECLKISAPEESFICEDCESGRFPLYNEIAWVKLGAYRWWPAIILYPNEIPENVKARHHNRGEFAVRFFGTHDYYWVNRGRVFIFQEGDTGNTSAKKTQVDGVFLRAIEEATAASKVLKDERERRTEEFRNHLKPPLYVKINKNRPVGTVKLFDGNTSNTTPCECNPDAAEPCGPDSDCLNRILLTECDPMVCPAGSKCRNQMFEKRTYPPLTPYKTQGRGWGLKVLTELKKGEFIIEYVGEMIDETEYQRRLSKMHEKKDENYYFLTIDKDRMLDAGPKGNVARFMNHSCQPNCETQKWTVNGSTRVGLFASEDIPANTELTFNYNLECVGEEKKICRCGAPNCSGFIGVKAKQQQAEPAKISKKASAKIQRLKDKKQKLKDKKKQLALASLAEPERPCFQCGKPENIRLCQNKLCNRLFHSKCVGLKAWPDGKWFCPSHNCNICSKRTTRCCTKCTNSYCPPHALSNIRYDKTLASFLCTVHDVLPLNNSKPSINPVPKSSTPVQQTSNSTTKAAKRKDRSKSQPSASTSRTTSSNDKNSKKSLRSSTANVTDGNHNRTLDSKKESTTGSNSNVVKVELENEEVNVTNPLQTQPNKILGKVRDRVTRSSSRTPFKELLASEVDQQSPALSASPTLGADVETKRETIENRDKKIASSEAEIIILEDSESKDDIIDLTDDVVYPVKKYNSSSDEVEVVSDEKNDFMKSLSIVERSSAVQKRRSSRLVISTAAAETEARNKLEDSFIAERRKSNNINFDVSVVLVKTRSMEHRVSECVKKMDEMERNGTEENAKDEAEQEKEEAVIASSSSKRPVTEESVPAGENAVRRKRPEIVKKLLVKKEAAVLENNKKKIVAKGVVTVKKTPLKRNSQLVKNSQSVNKHSQTVKKSNQPVKKTSLPIKKTRLTVTKTRIPVKKNGALVNGILKKNIGKVNDLKVLKTVKSANVNGNKKRILHIASVNDGPPMKKVRTDRKNSDK